MLYSAYAILRRGLNMNFRESHLGEAKLELESLEGLNITSVLPSIVSCPISLLIFVHSGPDDTWTDDMDS